MTASAITIDDLELQRRQAVSQRAFHRALAGASRGARLVEGPGGVQATIVPAGATVSVVNNAFYDDPAQLARQLPAITAAYAEAGVQHWGVWVPAEDRDTAKLLRGAGHTRRLAPMVMGGEIAATDLAREARVELEPHPTAAMVARCNDVAFGVPAPLTLADAFAAVDDDAIRAHVALRDGELACGVLVTHVERNLYTWGLAGTPAARGSIVAVRLMRAVMRDARDRGCETVTCETTPAAQTIASYFRLRPVGRLALWERRAGPAPGPGSAGA